MKAKMVGSGWHSQSIRHSNARRFGRAGGKYASYSLGTSGSSMNVKILKKNKDGSYDVAWGTNFKDRLRCVPAYKLTSPDRKFGKANNDEKIIKEYEKMTKMNGGGYFDPKDEFTDDKFIKNLKEGKNKEELKNILNDGLEIADEAYNEELGQVDTTSQQRMMTRSKDKLDKQFDKVVKLIEARKFGKSYSYKYQIGKDYIINKVIYDAVYSSSIKANAKQEATRYTGAIVRKDLGQYTILVPVSPTMDNPNFEGLLVNYKGNWKMLRG